MKSRLLAYVVPPLLAVLMALPLVPAQAATATTVSASVSATSVVAGKTVTISGAASGPRGRRVVLQLSTGTGWRAVATGQTNSERRYRLRVPTSWYNRHSLRVVAPATGSSRTGVSTTRVVQVRPGYAPAGQASDWGSLADSNARWNPCRAITWKFNRNRGYDGSLADVQQALGRISRATGIRFSYRGTTTRVAYRDDPDPTVALTISFGTARDVADLRGSTAGMGGGVYTVHDGTAELIRGELILDREETSLREGFANSGNPTWGQVMVHELGHVMGLDHAESSSQLMYGSVTSSNHRLGAGDLTGFNRVGMRAGCIANSRRTA